MARRDVDLVVRARDEAAKVIESITKAIGEFNEGQQALEGRAGKTESSLTKLGAAFAKIQQAVGDTSGLDKLNQGFDKAKANYDQFRASVDRTQESFARSQRALRQADDTLTRHSQKLAGAVAAYDRQKVAIDRIKVAQRELEREYARVETAQRRASTAQERLPAQIERQAAAVARAEANYRKLEAQITGTVGPSKRLQASFEASGAALTRQQERLDTLRTRYATLGSQIGSNAQIMDRLKGVLASTGAELAKKQTVLARVGQGVERWRAQTSASAQNQKALASEVQKTGTALNQQNGQLVQARTELARFAGQTREASTLMQQFAQQGAQALRREFLGSVRDLQQTRAAYEGMTDIVRRMAQEIGRVGVPTRQMAAAFEQAKVTAGQAKQEFQQQQQTLQRLRTTYAELASGTITVEQAQRRFVQLQQQARAAMAQTAQAAQTKRAAITASYGATQQAANANARLAGSTREVTAAKRQETEATRTLKGAYDQLYGGSRQSLSLLQRIRGEVLALAATYVGLFAAIRGVGGVISTLQRLEGVQSRLNVIFEGDQTAASLELDFIRRNADRLGISMAVLADQYTKFAVASRGTNLEGQATRDIFIAVAEAARVNKASQQQLELTFLALEQMVSKGSVTMEELRRQLGDQLPGAFNLMADAAARAGLITHRLATRELSDLIQNGNLSSDILVTFAEVLRERFGPGLEAALNTITTSFGRFTNAVFQATLAIGRGGFEQSIIQLLDTMSAFLQSGQAISIAERIGRALASLVGVLQLAADNFSLIIAAIGVFIGIRATPFIVAMSTSLGRLTQVTLTVPAATAAASAGITATGVAAGAATGNVARLTAAIRALWLASGAAVVIPIIGAALALWATSTDSATDALVRHRSAVDQIRNAYDAAEGSFTEWQRRVADVTVTQLRENLEETESAIRQVSQRIAAMSVRENLGVSGLVGSLFRASDYAEVMSAIDDLTARYRGGGITAREFRDEVIALNEGLGDAGRVAQQYGRDAEAMTRRLVDLEDAAEEARLSIVAKTGTEEEATAALRRLTGAQDDANRATFDAVAVNREYQTALRELQGLVPDIAEELRRMDEIGRLTAARDGALRLAQNLGQALNVLRLFEQGMANIETESVGRMVSGMGDVTNTTNSVAASMALLRQFEGFRNTPYWDVNALRTGYGSDTITLSDGTIRRVTAGMRVSVEDANRDLQRRVTAEFMPTARRQAGDDRWRQFNAQQQAALTSIAYNYGSLPDRILGAVRSGTDAEVATAIRSLGSDNAGVNRGRRNREAALFVSNAGEGAQLREANEREVAAAREAERRSEAERRTTESITQRIDGMRFENSLATESRENAEVARVLRQAELEAQRAGLELTEEQRAALESETRTRVRNEEAARAARDASRSSQREENVELEAARSAQEQVNQLTAQQAAMRREMALAEEQGNNERVAELRTELEGVNAALLEAIDNAIRMWEAVGGQQAATSIAQLRLARAEAQGLAADARQNEFDWKRVADLFVNGLVNAFQRFAQAVAEGKSVGEAAKEAFLQFAAEFLIEIGKMIIQQMIMNALQGIFGGTPMGAMMGLGHTGGLVGSSRVGSGNQSRRVSPTAFAGAMRYHTGGIAGLRPGEVPIIAQQGEEILTQDDPRHMFNQGGGGGGGDGRQMKIVNAFDASDLFSEALGSAAGEEVFVNYVRRNRSRVKTALGLG